MSGATPDIYRACGEDIADKYYRNIEARLWQRYRKSGDKQEK
jgi:hypothetical protein